MSPDDVDSPFQRFARSMRIDYERWHDGIGYDLAALRAASPPERARIEALLLPRATRDWRDVEALAAIDTPRARAALLAAAEHATAEIRIAVLRYAPGLIGERQRIKALVAALDAEDMTGGWPQALDEAAAFHPAEAVAALLRGALDGSGVKAVHFAAMLMYVHGQAREPFDLALRPFFLQFNTADRAQRVAAFRALCARIGIDAETYL